MASEIEISFGKSSALVRNEGAALVNLVLDGHPVIPSIADPASVYAGTVLAPWPNRIKEGRYQFKGETFELTNKDELGNALHGLIGNQLAEVTALSSNRVTFRSEINPTSGYPFEVSVSSSYELDDSGLRVTHSATNNSPIDAPVGLGAHPYFPFDDQTKIELRAKSAAVHGVDKLPYDTIPAGELGLGIDLKPQVKNLNLDTQFGELEPTQTGVVATLIRDVGKVEFWVDGARNLMLYTTTKFPWGSGLGGAIAIEPQTCAANAFNSGEGLVVLKPGETLNLAWGVKYRLA